MPGPNRKDDAWISDLVGALCDPLIVFPSQWSADIPDNLKKQITLERLIMNMKVSKEGKGVPVGDCEALAYMFPRTMESPMGYEWTHIYQYCFTKAMTFMKVEVPPDLRVESLSDYDMYQLDDLKRFIWDRRLKHRKERERGEKRSEQDKNNQEEKETQPAFF
ncbi:MAG: hypothetical protein PHU23_04935 [Dehalococcoidales bacterium]|nr:hypothetical protein [Dehalococcoidales bacterium]